MERRTRVAATAKSLEQATARFIALNGEIETLINQIADANREHFGVDPETLNWGHVGDAARVRDGLAEILAIIRGENQ